MKRAGVIVFLACTWLACGSSEDRVMAGTPCSAGESRPCTCEGGGAGTQSCTNGTLSACSCAGGQTTTGTRTCATAAGDGGANPVKKCQVCDFDVDASKAAACPGAPSCGNGNLGAPAGATPRLDLSIHTDNGSTVPIAGAGPAPSTPPGTCLDAQLRIRVQKVKVHKGGGEAYCIIQANDGITSEAALTMKTSNLKDGDEFPFPVGQAMLWGQTVPECTSNNLTISYYCYHVVDNSAWSAALGAMGDTAAKIGGSPSGGGQYGWAFGLGGAAANAAAAAITAASKDENRIRLEQTIPVNSLLDLTNGRTWTVRVRVQDGCGLLGCDRDYDWELTLQAWGCAERIADVR